ncbi:MAG TPA: MarR family transcriptional regulator [Gemmatimonadales bacterium]|jgi:DNA-binding MarR family transcriptional regulator|nr:MarR family transcriptional regulator [Gemmatimonadales bacterium]
MLLRAAHLLEDRLGRALEEVDLTLSQFAVISALVNSGEAQTLSDLAAQVRCVRSNMTQLVDRLEAEGLVRRVSDVSDRRVVRAQLTALGVERAAAGADRVAMIEAQFEESLSTSDRIALKRMAAALQ